MGHAVWQANEGAAMEASARCVVRGSNGYESEQGPTYSPGVSAETAGAKALFLGVVTMNPGARTKSHIHELHESAFYMVSGDEVHVFTGDRLEHKEIARPGDYIFIPPQVPHVVVNRSETTPAVFVGARNEPTAMESVLMLPDLDGLVP
jgi:uncharacterized RmlC-like cupin family protein